MISTKMTEGNKPYITDVTQDDEQKLPETKGVLLQAKEVTIRTHAGVSLLSDISFHIEPGELVVLTGISHSGKSILLQSLAGLIKPVSGEILIDGINLYANLKAFQPIIGFVPSTFALPQNLTVIEVLQEAARLRLPSRTPAHDREQRVLTLLETMGLTQVTGSRVSSLSRLEKRKLGIAVELIGYPGILLLDEAAEWGDQLTAFEEIQITILLRELSRQGLTIIQVDHRSRRAGLSDKVIFLAPGGLLTWFGPPDEAFIYLKSILPRGVVRDLFGLREALEMLVNPQIQEGNEWAKRFKDNPAYQKYVDDPLQNRYPDLMLQTRPLIRLRLRNSSKEKLPPTSIPRASGIQKLILMIRRNFRLLWRDKTLLPLIAVAPWIAVVDFLLSSGGTLSSDRAPMILGPLLFLLLLTAALLVQNEIFKERAIYQRESRNSSILLPYVFSKVWLVGIFAIYEGLVWAIIHFIATGLTGGFQILGAYGIIFFMVALIGGILGLMVSALARTPIMMSSWLLLFTVPQLLLSGSIIPTTSPNFLVIFLLAINPLRYAVEALLTTSGLSGDSNMTSFGSLSVLVIMSLGLILILTGIQRGAGRIRT